MYEGVRGKYEGTLFGGLKFWIHLRVPMRTDLIEKIQVSFLILDRNQTLIDATGQRRKSGST